MLSKSYDNKAKYKAWNELWASDWFYSRNHQEQEYDLNN